jgi:hypothetical protein
MSWTDYSKIPLYHLVMLCEGGDEEALIEWKRRWESEYPHMGE